MNRVIEESTRLQGAAVSALNKDDLDRASLLFEQLSEMSETNDLETLNVKANKYLARIYTRQKKFHKAIASCTKIVNLRPNDPTTILQLARLNKRTNQLESAKKYFESYLEISPEHQESTNAINEIELVEKHLNAGNPDWEAQHIAIAGISFCGSTLLTLILGSLEGVKNIGESHRLKSGAGLLVSDKNAAQPSHCKKCGEACRYLTDEFRLKLIENPVHWYSKIAKQLNTRVLISSDKNHSKFLKLDPKLDMNAIVLYKSPIQSCYSYYKKYLEPENYGHREFTIEDFVATWTTEYSKFLHDFNIKGDKIVLSFDEFCKDPHRHLQRICEIFKLPYDEKALRRISNHQHYIGGNKSLNRPYRERIYDIDIKFREDIDLPEEFVKLLKNNTAINELNNKLYEKYQASFCR